MQYIVFRALFIKRFPINFMKPHPWGFFVRSGYVMVFAVGQKHTPSPVLKRKSRPLPACPKGRPCHAFCRNGKSPAKGRFLPDRARTARGASPHQIIALFLPIARCSPSTANIARASGIASNPFFKNGASLLPGEPTTIFKSGRKLPKAFWRSRHGQRVQHRRGG
jgi:hypothetical protein